MTHFLLVHGFLGQPEQWQRLEAELQGRGHTTRALALPRGTWDDDLAAVDDALTVDGRPTVLVGHSLGGSLVRAFAFTRPDVAFGLGTIAAPPPSFVARFEPDFLAQDADGSFRPADVRAWLDLAFPGAPAEFADLDWRHPPQRGNEPEGNSTGVEPRVAILAEDDAVVPRPDQERAAALLRAPTAWVPGGHSPHVRHPALVATLLTNWLTPGT